MIIKIQSDRDVYYEYDQSAQPLWEDAWGKYFLGKSYSKRSSCFLKDVTVCVISEPFIASSLWMHIKEKGIEFKQTAFIPIIDYISCGDDYLIEDFCDGVSLYDLMHGQICGVNRQPFEFAVKMFEMYQKRRNDFAKIIAMKIKQEINSIHLNNYAIRFIEAAENIIFTVSGEIKIRIRGSLLSVCHLKGAISPDMFDTLYPVEFAPPEGFKLSEKSECSENYTIGILLFCILTGHLPYEGGTTLEDCHLAHSPYIDPRDDNYVKKPYIRLHCYEKLLLNEITDKHLRKVVEKATKLNPLKRFQSAVEFVNALEDTKEVHIPWYKKTLSLFNLKKNWLPLILFTALFAFFFCPNSDAQNTMRISYKDGGIYETPIERIDSITFVEKQEESHDTSIIGDWFWGSKEKGYYELLTLNEDRTYTGYDYYLEYGFDTWTYGTYITNGVMLYLWSNGLGYTRKQTWFVTGLTENALEVMSKMGSFVYYRVQPDVFSIKLGEENFSCENGDYYVFTDGVKVTESNGKLKGVGEGVTYILKYCAESELVLAYKVIVEQ